MNIIALLKAFFSTLSSFFEWKHDEALRDDGAREVELESRKAQDEVMANIDRNVSDKQLRESFQKRHTRRAGRSVLQAKDNTDT